MPNSGNQQNLKMNNGESKEQTTLESMWEKTNTIIRKSKYLSIISLNVNGLNSLIKRHRLFDWIKKQDPMICSLSLVHSSQPKIHTD
jgi:hypothetical protein